MSKRINVSLKQRNMTPEAGEAGGDERNSTQGRKGAKAKRSSFAAFVIAMLISLNGVMAQEVGESAGRDVSVQPKLGIEMGAPFTDNAILQREMPVPVWGWSKPGAKVTVEFQGQQKSVVVGAEGNPFSPEGSTWVRWLVTLDPLKASAEPAEMLIRDDAGNKVTLKDILVGEVWICSGQSNMQYGWGKESLPIFNWGGDATLAALVPDAKTKPIRSYTVQNDVSLTPSKSCRGTWSRNASGSAVAFGFSYHLYRTLQVPVGVVVTCWGSSSIEGWMPRELTAQLPYFKTIMERFDADTNTLNRIRSASGCCKPHGNVFERQQPNVLYNAMLHPLIPYACRGMVWYQGEANGKQPVQYAESLPLWIKRLRAEWARDELSFLIVMLPGYGDESWPWFREVQMGVLKVPHTSVANTIDLGDTKNIHPPDKAAICERLSLLARRDVYGENVEAIGPVFKSFVVKDHRVAIKFDHADGLKTTNGAAPAGFMLAGSDNVWRPAKASLKGNMVEVEAEGLAAPVFVRYAFSGKPTVNLVNGAGQPAYPFRTDDWSK